MSLTQLEQNKRYDRLRISLLGLMIVVEKMKFLMYRVVLSILLANMIVDFNSNQLSN